MSSWEYLNFFYIYSVREAYQEVISNNARIIDACKELKRNYKYAFKEIELMQKKIAMSDDLSTKNVQLLTTNKDLCEENKDLK